MLKIMNALLYLGDEAYKIQAMLLQNHATMSRNGSYLRPPSEPANGSNDLRLFNQHVAVNKHLPVDSQGTEVRPGHY